MDTTAQDRAMDVLYRWTSDDFGDSPEVLAGLLDVTDAADRFRRRGGTHDHAYRLDALEALDAALTRLDVAVHDAQEGGKATA